MKGRKLSVHHLDLAKASLAHFSSVHTVQTVNPPRPPVHVDVEGSPGFQMHPKQRGTVLAESSRRQGVATLGREGESTQRGENIAIPRWGPRRAHTLGNAC